MTVGAVIRGTKGDGKGTLILMPPPQYPAGKFTETRGSKQFWNNKGIAFGQSFVSALLEIEFRQQNLWVDSGSGSRPNV